MLDWSQCPAVERAPYKGAGEWLFTSTRVPVRALFENLEGGARVDDFLEWFPGVTRAASGHAAAAPTSAAMNSRRPRQLLICPSHARKPYRKRIARPKRAVL